jgi:hypothetical protein
VAEAKDTEIAALRVSHRAQLDVLQAQVAALAGPGESRAGRRGSPAPRRTTFRFKADDLDVAGLQLRIGASSLTRCHARFREISGRMEAGPELEFSRRNGVTQGHPRRSGDSLMFGSPDGSERIPQSLPGTFSPPDAEPFSRS